MTRSNPQPGVLSRFIPGAVQMRQARQRAMVITIRRTPSGKATATLALKPGCLPTGVQTALTALTANRRLTVTVRTEDQR